MPVAGDFSSICNKNRILIVTVANEEWYKLSLRTKKKEKIDI